MEEITVNKLEAAKRQLIQVIEWFFDYGDMVPIHVVAAAACELMTDLCKAKDAAREFEDGDEFKSLPKNLQDEFFRAIRKPQNFLKHADKDPDETITYRTILTELLIYIACQMYRSLEGKLFHEGTVFQLWFLRKYGESHFGGWTEVEVLIPGVSKASAPDDYSEYLRLVRIKR